MDAFDLDEVQNTSAWNGAPVLCKSAPDNRLTTDRWPSMTRTHHTLLPVSWKNFRDELPDFTRVVNAQAHGGTDITPIPRSNWNRIMIIADVH